MLPNVTYAAVLGNVVKGRAAAAVLAVLGLWDKTRFLLKVWPEWPTP